MPPHLQNLQLSLGMITHELNAVHDQLNERQTDLEAATAALEKVCVRWCCREGRGLQDLCSNWLV